MVSTLSSFQTQMTSILETLMKSAIMEISKLVDIESNVLLLELRHSRREICELKEKLKLMESQRQEDVRTKTGKNRETADDLYRDIPTHGLTARGQVECKPSMDSPRYCEIHQPNKMIKTERCDAEITRWDNGEHGTQRVQRGEEKPVIIKNAVEKVNQGSQEMETTGVRPPTSESLQPTEKMTVNQAACASSSTCASHTDKSSTNPSPSANASKSMRTCSDPVIQAKRFVCGFCSKRFRCFSRLEVHQRSHTGEKPYRCTLCGKRYAQKGHLYTHQRTHTGEKPYRCALCGKGFIQKCTLDMHLRSHTGEKPFTCTICGKGFTKKCNLNKHLSYQSCIS